MTTFYQLTQVSHSQMMSYVIQAGDGSLVVIDGGTKADAPYLLSVLEHLGGKQPRVQAWFLTHPHLDHFDAFLELMANHSGAFHLERLYCHLPEPDFVAQNESGSVHTIQEFNKLLPRFLERQVTLQEGDVVSVGDINFEVLYTTDPAFTKDAVNNTSMVLRMETCGCAVLFLGDLAVSGGEKLLAQHPEKLPCQIVQMAHHGQNGVAFPVYEKIAPKLCMWNTPLWLWENNQGERGYNSGPWKTFEVREWMSRLAVPQHIVTKDGTWRVALDAGDFRLHQLCEGEPLYQVPGV